MNRAWQLMYGTTLTIVIAGLGTIAYCVAHDRPTLAVGSLALFLCGVIGFRMVWEIDILHRRRMRLADAERALTAERGVFDADKERALRDLADQEHAMRDTFSIQRRELHRQLDAERDQMETDFANKKAELQRAAFRKAFEMAQNGIATEQRAADVIVLPVGENRPTIMGTGTTNQ